MHGTGRRLLPPPFALPSTSLTAAAGPRTSEPTRPLTLSADDVDAMLALLNGV
jgi:hypothetical protein